MIGSGCKQVSWCNPNSDQISKREEPHSPQTHESKLNQLWNRSLRLDGTPFVLVYDFHYTTTDSEAGWLSSHIADEPKAVPVASSRHVVRNQRKDASWLSLRITPYKPDISSTQQGGNSQSESPLSMPVAGGLHTAEPLLLQPRRQHIALLTTHMRA